MARMKLKLTGMAHGGQALARDKKNHVIFVPGGIPGEMVEIEVDEGDGKKKFLNGELKKVIKASRHRQQVKDSIIGPHGGYSYAHINYKAQLEYKRSVALDQLKRLGGITVKAPRFVASPKKWEYDHDVVLSPTERDGFGIWDQTLREVVPLPGPLKSLIQPLQDVIKDFDFELPGLRRMLLRAPTEGDLLVAFEIDGVEPPELLVDFPISAAIILPDRTTANLIGDMFITRKVNDHLFRITAGCEFPGNPDVVGLQAKKVVELAQLKGKEVVLDCYSGVGVLSHHLAQKAGELHGIDRNPDAIADAAINLADTENVSLYQGSVEEVLPMIDIKPDLVVVNPPALGLSKDAIMGIMKLKARKLIYVASDLATMARDSKILKKGGYQAMGLDGFDMYPQTFHMSLVTVWVRK